MSCVELLIQLSYRRTHCNKRT